MASLHFIGDIAMFGGKCDLVLTFVEADDRLRKGVESGRLMSSAIIQFVIVNAVSMAVVAALVSLTLFLFLNRSGGWLGVAFALLSSVVYVFIPFFGGYLTVISGIMAFLVGTAYFWVAIGVVIINILNVVMYSPMLRGNVYGAVQAGDYKWAVFYIALIVIQAVVGLVIFYRYMEYRKDEDLEEPFEFVEEQDAGQTTLTTL